MSRLASRRHFLKTAAMGGVALLVSGTAEAQPAAPLRIRKSALELAPGDPVFSKYAQAVQAMHALPQTDRRNWWRQAQIHADFCVHGGRDFLPWHRHYINQFEKICGQLIGDPSFALPYWDWSYGTGVIPDPFFDVNLLDVTFWNDPGMYSPPNWPGIDTIALRAIGKGVGVQSDPVRGGAFTGTNINSILAEGSFNRFTGRLEGSPHNSGHVVVGFPAMGKPGHIGSGLSPLDPLFWLHHCNVDRLWAQWQMAGNTTPNFTETYNGQFVDESGMAVDVTAAGATDFSSLGYSYQQFEDPREVLRLAGLLPAGAAAAPLFPAGNQLQPTAPVMLGSARPQNPIEVGVPFSIPISVRDLQAQLAATRPILDANLPTPSSIAAHGIDAAMLEQFGKPRMTFKRVLANIVGAKADSANPVVNVFLNCPYLAPETPYADAHYADTFAFFGPRGAGHHAHARSFVVDLTRAIRAVDLNNAETIKFQLMAVGADQSNPAGSCSVESIEIFSA